jgi:hypothetical protein
LSKPWWVDRPLAFARYLLPIVPVLLLSLASGLSRLATALSSRAPPSVVGWLPAALAGAAVVAWLPTTPIAETLRRPNSYTQHSYIQYDYREDRNPVRIGQALFPASAFWKTLASAPAGSLTVAVAPFRFSTYEWPAPIWEAESRQRVIPAYVWGACEKERYGEVPPGEDFPFRNAVHLAGGWYDLRQRVDYLAYYRGPRWSNVSPLMPQCEAWVRERFGRPFHEDAALIVWKNPR